MTKETDNKQENVISSESSERLEQLYSEAQAVKMLNLRKIIMAQGEQTSDSLAEALKNSQMALKAIGIQLKILGEKSRNEKSGTLPREFTEIWDVLMELPEIRATLNSRLKKDQVLRSLKERQGG